ncbi:MAG: PilZ domain-containing protein [Nitrospira sp.]|nr:PilZ domain-containing protein [Nitrospira sp.]
MTASDLYQRGLVLKKAHMFQQAIEDFQQATQDPRYAPQAYLQIALCHKAVGHLDDALAALRLAAASPALSTEERLHVLYQVARLLEDVGRLPESVEIYGLIRKENPAFGDVAHRSRRLAAGGGRAAASMSESSPIGQASSQDHSLWGAGIRSLLRLTEGWWKRMSLVKPMFPRRPDRESEKPNRAGDGPDPGTGTLEKRQTGRSSKGRVIDHRRCARRAVRLPSSFAAQGYMVAGKGELRDLSPWGCRISSPVSVPVGTTVQCCIFCGHAEDVLLIEEATVRWIGPREFGLSFTTVSPAAQERLVRLYKAAA